MNNFNQAQRIENNYDHELIQNEERVYHNGTFADKYDNQDYDFMPTTN